MLLPNWAVCMSSLSGSLPGLCAVVRTCTESLCLHQHHESCLHKSSSCCCAVLPGGILQCVPWHNFVQLYRKQKHDCRRSLWHTRCAVQAQLCGAFHSSGFCKQAVLVQARQGSGGATMHPMATPSRECSRAAYWLCPGPAHPTQRTHSYIQARLRAAVQCCRQYHYARTAPS
jgi:hypothetical protein